MAHDRTGEEITDDTESVGAPFHDPRCIDGWIDYENADEPKPCYVCRPNLRPDALRRRAYLDDPRPDPLNTRRNLETS
ncbi:hypothetical protein [Amycolatopsis sp. NPDC049159]|uniref:hypothetical protein n=1 Tax=Amycolatopsis sp. NPDC049159 TaxID=3157210 RepID=UPI0033CF6C14